MIVICVSPLIIKINADLFLFNLTYKDIAEEEVLLFLLLRMRRREQKRKKKREKSRFWVRHIFRQREQYGKCSNSAGTEN